MKSLSLAKRYWLVSIRVCLPSLLLDSILKFRDSLTKIFCAAILQEIEATGRNAVEAALAPLGPSLGEDVNWSGIDEVGFMCASNE